MKKGTLPLTIGTVFFLAACGGGGGGGDDGGYERPLQRIAFHTSVTGTGDLSTWADAGGLSGLDAADAVCQARADDAGITGTFVAWASDSTDDAYCRAHGLTGKRSVNCGQGELPAWAGPYVRVDGTPFGETLDQMLGYRGIVYSGMVLDEYGNTDSEEIHFLTGTGYSGEAKDHCTDWTTTSGSVTIGVNTGTNGRWMGGGGSGNCDSSRALLCLEVGVDNEPLPAFTGTGKKVFVTSASGTGNLGSWDDAWGQTGMDAGDAVCRELAANGGLANFSNFKVFLSSNTMHAKDRFTGNGPYYRTDGMLVAETFSALLNSWLVGSISTNEDGEIIDVSSWTGTLTSGVKSADVCSSWYSASSGKSGRVGDTSYIDSQWIGYSSYPCDNVMHLYCIED